MTNVGVELSICFLYPVKMPSILSRSSVQGGWRKPVFPKKTIDLWQANCQFSHTREPHPIPPPKLPQLYLTYRWKDKQIIQPLEISSALWQMTEKKELVPTGLSLFCLDRQVNKPSLWPLEQGHPPILLFKWPLKYILN